MLSCAVEEKLNAEDSFSSSSNKKLFQFVSISIMSLAGVSDLTARAVISHQCVSSSCKLSATGASLMPAIKQIAARHLQLFNVFMQMLQ
jgi:hypothetical protein